METPRPNYQNRNTLGKIARKYCCEVITLEKIIEGFPELKTTLDNYFGNRKNRGNSIIPPTIVNQIFTTLGEP